MDLPKNRLPLKFFATLVFLFISYLMLRSIYLAREYPAYFEETVSPLPLIFVLIIMTSWFFFGLIEGLTFLLLAVITILLTSGISGYYLYNYQILILAGVAWFIVRRSKIKFNALSLLKSNTEDEEKKYGNLEIKHEEENSLKEALAKKNQRYMALEEILEGLSQRMELEETTDAVINKTFEIIGRSNACLLFLVDKEKQNLALTGSRYSLNSSAFKSKTGDIFDHWVFKQRQPLLIEDIKKDFRFDASQLEEKEHFFNSIISVPLISENKMIGILRLDSDKVGAYHQDDLRLLGIIANLASLALENALLYKETQELAVTDSLTGLYVHNYFCQRLAEEITNNLRTKGYFSLLMVDIDYFKNYNDSYGHSAGDSVLKAIAKIIKSVGGSHSLAARYGGEEFCLLLPSVSKEKAITLAEDLRKKVEDYHFILRRVKTTVTVSIGVVSFPDDAQIEHELIHNADKSLYRAKAEGRNRVCIF